MLFKLPMKHLRNSAIPFQNAHADRPPVGDSSGRSVLSKAYLFPPHKGER